MRSQRRRDLLRILQDGRASSQEEIVAALHAKGHDVTQATVSRDLRELGAMKLRLGDKLVYRLPDDVPAANRDLLARRLDRTLAEFALDVRVAGSIVVLITPPGHAGLLARAIDQAGAPETVGTVAGDDTIFVATPSGTVARRVAARWLTSMGTAEVAR